VSAEKIFVVDHDDSRGVLVHVSSETEQDRVIDALSQLGDAAAASAGDESSRQLVDKLVVPGQPALVSVITPITVAEAVRTVSSRSSNDLLIYYCPRGSDGLYCFRRSFLLLAR